MAYEPQYQTWCPVDANCCNHLPDAEAAIEHVLTHDPRLVAKVLLRERYVHLLMTDAMEQLERDAEIKADEFMPDPLAGSDVVCEIQFTGHEEATENK